METRKRIFMDKLLYLEGSQRVGFGSSWHFCPLCFQLCTPFMSFLASYEFR